MAYKLGLNTTLFFGTVGTTAGTELINCKDITLNPAPSEVDVTAASLKDKDFTLAFKTTWDNNATGFQALKNAYFDYKPIAIFAKNDDGHGLDADFIVTSMVCQHDKDICAFVVSFTCKPTRVARMPVWK